MFQIAITLLVLTVIAGGISSLVLRIVLIEIVSLHSALFKESGRPRALYLSDALPLRVFQERHQFNAKHATLIWIVFLVWVVTLVSGIFLTIFCLWIFSRS